MYWEVPNTNGTLCSLCCFFEPGVLQNIRKTLRQKFKKSCLATKYTALRQKKMSLKLVAYMLKNVHRSGPL